jgi:hypothetical protein
MIKASIREVLTNFAEPKDACIYVIGDEETILYIGQAKNGVCDRIQSHCGMGTWGWGNKDNLGSLISDNAPASYNWTVEMYSISDFNCDWNGRTDEFKAMHAPIEIDRIEGMLIRKMKPCLNVMHNIDANILPEKYNKHPIANEGVFLGDD